MDNEVTVWKITPLTPLHIGDGNELQADMDYVRSKEGLAVQNVDSILEELASIPRAVNEVGRGGFDLGRLIKDYGLSTKAAYILPYSGKSVPSSLRSVIKDAYGKVYIPGSSLKGALRTALWVGAVKDGKLPKPAGDYKRDYRSKVTKLMSPSPHRDFLRSFRVSDSTAISPQECLSALDIQYLNVLSGNKAGWIDFGRPRRNVDDYSKAHGIVIEGIKPKSEFFIRIERNAFLQKARVREAAKIPECKMLEDMAGICHAVNRHALGMITREKSFFDEFKQVVPNISETYAKLKDILLKEISADKEMVVRLSWGSGWKGMTGDWMDDQHLAFVRSKARLGKKEASIFPKTRRLALDNGIPALPLGWARLTLCDDSFQFVREASKLTEVTLTKKDSSEVVPQAEPSKAPEKSLEERKEEVLDDFVQYLSKLPNIASEIDGIESRVREQDDAELQKQMVQKVFSKAKKAKNYKKARSAGKPWVLRIDQLAEEFL